MSVNTLPYNTTILNEIAQAVSPSVNENFKLLLVRKYQLQDTSGTPLPAIAPISGTNVNNTIGKNLYINATVNFYSNAVKQVNIRFMNTFQLVYNVDVADVMNTISFNLPDNLSPYTTTISPTPLSLTIETTDQSNTLYTTPNCYVSFMVYESNL